MSKKIQLLLISIIGIILNLLIINFVGGNINNSLKLNLTISSEQAQTYQIFYSTDGNWNEEQSIFIDYNAKNYNQELRAFIPSNTNYIRLDFGNIPSKYRISKFNLKYKKHIYNIDLNMIKNSKTNSMISDIKLEDKVLKIVTGGNDSYTVIDISQLGINDIVVKEQHRAIFSKNIIICICIDLLLIIILKYRKLIILFPKELYQNRQLIFNLAKNDFKTKYAGSYLGIIWAFIQPIVTILTYWFVFQIGFKSGTVNNFPFVLWLITGLVPWFFFSDAILNGTNCMLEYSYLVKKVVFPISILPFIKVISSAFVHLFFIVFIVFLFTLCGYSPNLYSLQTLYYSFSMFILVVGISYATCSIVIFFRDLGQIINIILQVGMWMTPIMWNYTMVPQKYQWVLKLNPMYYIIEGYRDSLINDVWFWENTNQFIYFWFITALLFALGTLIFRRLKVHFADIL